MKDIKSGVIQSLLRRNFTFLGIMIFLALMQFGPEIMAKLNSKQQQEFSAGMTQMTAQMRQTQAVKIDSPIIVPGLLKAKRPSINNWEQGQITYNDRSLAKLIEQNQDIKNAIEETKESLEYLEGRENNREVRKRLKVFGNILLNLPF